MMMVSWDLDFLVLLSQLFCGGTHSLATFFVTVLALVMLDMHGITGSTVQ